MRIWAQEDSGRVEIEYRFSDRSLYEKEKKNVSVHSLQSETIVLLRVAYSLVVFFRTG